MATKRKTPAEKISEHLKNLEIVAKVVVSDEAKIKDFDVMIALADTQGNETIAEFLKSQRDFTITTQEKDAARAKKDIQYLRERIVYQMAKVASEKEVGSFVKFAESLALLLSGQKFFTEVEVNALIAE